MDIDRWREISRLYHAVLARPAEEQRAFLEVACRSDDALRAEVESLLRSAASGEAFLASPPAAVTADTLTHNSRTPTMSLDPGAKLGSYAIERPLGRGGTGTVFLARDTTLHRRVALKVLDVPAGGESARALVLREARNAAALSHPNICTVYEVGEANGCAFIAMEFVEGRPLNDRLALSALSVTEAIRYGIEAADALAYAHEHGVIHRDLKAANAIVTPTGRVKLVDFGLARREDALLADATTLRSLAPVGAALGTPYAMAPEQVRGGVTDARTDIWALGVLLYEMVGGAQPFTAATIAELFSSILRDPPAPLPDSVPVDLLALIARCLEKEPARRYQRASDVRVALETIQARVAAPKWVVAPIITLPRGAAFAAALLLIAGLIAWQAWAPSESTEALRAVPLTTLPGVERYPSLSPDGNYIAFTWNGPKQENSDIYVQQIGAGAPLRLTTNPLVDYSPVWSPDGRAIAFLREQPDARVSELRLIPPLGGPERRLTDIQPRQFLRPVTLAWCPDSSCLVVTDSSSPDNTKPDAVLFAVSTESGKKTQLTFPRDDAYADTDPAVSPNGRWLVFRRDRAPLSGQLQLLQLEGNLTVRGEPQNLTPTLLEASGPAWISNMEILFSAKGALWRMNPFEGRPAERLPFVGEDGQMPVVSRPPPGQPARLAYVRSYQDTNIWRIETVPGAAASSPAVVAVSSTREDFAPHLSPDGQRVAFQSRRSGDNEVWVSDTSGAIAVQLTSLGANPGFPRWSPDGKTIVFHSNSEERPTGDIFVVPAEGGIPRNLTAHTANDNFASFSRDGRWIYFSSTRTGTPFIWKIPASGGEAVLVSPTNGLRAIESTDGAYLYYVETISSNRPAPLWRLPLNGGEPVRLVEGVLATNFDVTDGGIYYVDPSSGGTLRYFDFTTRRSTVVAVNLGNIVSGLSASRDGRTIFFTRLDSSVDDLMLVENFR